MHPEFAAQFSALLARLGGVVWLIIVILIVLLIAGFIFGRGRW
jgi:hypothetical protein